MAFSQTTFLPVSGMANSDAPRQYIYKTDDAIATVKASAYFDDAYPVLAAKDIVYVVIGIAEVHILMVAAITAGVVTTYLITSQELTVSGTVNPGVKSIELNHISTAVAATVADAKAHQGLLTVVDTSASGTEAHTVTLTGGTWDGTNTIATLNAPAECLVVWIDSAGAGTIVENVGSVALS